MAWPAWFTWYGGCSSLPGRIPLANLSTTRFWLIATLLTAVLAVGSYFVLQAQAPEATWQSLAGLGFALLLIGISYGVVRPQLAARPMAFTNAVLGATGLKMFASILWVLVVGLVWRQAVVAVVVSYFATYFVLLAFEVRTLLANLRRLSENGHNKPQP